VKMHKCDNCGSEFGGNEIDLSLGMHFTKDHDLRDGEREHNEGRELRRLPVGVSIQFNTHDRDYCDECLYKAGLRLVGEVMRQAKESGRAS